MHVFIAACALLAGSGGAVEQENRTTAPEPARPRPDFATYDLLLSGICVDGAYRAAHASDTITIHPASIERIVAAVEAVGAAISIDAPPRSRESLLAEWMALDDDARTPPTKGVSPRRDLYVYSSQDRVVEAYYNDDDELDITRIRTPGVFVDYNPGRLTIMYTVEETFDRLLSLHYLYHPASLGRSYGLEFRDHKVAGDGERLLFQRGGMVLFIELFAGFPTRSVFVDRDMSIVAADFEHGTVGVDGAYYGLTAVRGIELIRVADGAQIRTFECTLSAHEFNRAPVIVDVDGLDNLFTTSPSHGGTEFRGRMDHVKLPELLKPLIRVSPAPKPIWKP